MSRMQTHQWTGVAVATVCSEKVGGGSWNGTSVGEPEKAGA
jgi:hypothetical protein